MLKIAASLIMILLPFYATAQVAAQRQDQGQRQDIVFAGKGAVARAFAYAPNVTTKCSGSAAAGAQGQFAGFSFAGSYKDEFCERAELIKIAMALDHPLIADALFMNFPQVKELMKIRPENKCDYPTKCPRR